MTTTQFAFNKMVTHLRAQGERALQVGQGNEYEACAYLAPNGNKCAVGCLISANSYNPYLEGKAYNEDEVVAALAESGYDDLSEDLLSAMQFLHDDIAVDHWEQGFKDVAIEHHLKVPEVK